MGYTHSFKQAKQVTPEAWARIAEDFHRLTENMPKHTGTAGGYFSQEPLCLATRGSQALNINREAIFFNGCDPETQDSESGADLAHDSFEICRREDSRNPFSGFCKTARKPYDLMVCAVLILADKYAPGCYRISSDGTPDEWEPALDLVSGVLGAGFELPAPVRNLDGFTEEFKAQYRAERAA